MSDDTRPDAPADEAPAKATPPDPAIPDGGLAEAMPDWLRRPPAWRGMPALDIPAAAEAVTPSQLDEPLASTLANKIVEADDAPAAKAIPSPDTSPIDPSSLIELDDLPEWLIGLGKRELPPRPASIPDAVERAVDGPAVPAPSIPLPPFLREGAAPESVLALATSAATDDPDAQDANSSPFAGMSPRFMVLAGVLLVVVLIAILLTYLG